MKTKILSTRQRQLDQIAGGKFKRRPFPFPEIDKNRIQRRQGHPHHNPS